MALLRLIDQLPNIDIFIDQGVDDRWLPFTTSSLPSTLTSSARDSFLQAQPLVLTKAVDLEKGRGCHAHFTREDPFSYEERGKLGQGGFGYVDKVLSPLTKREFARKRFRRQRGVEDSYIQSFKNEVDILKRIKHIHCVELVG